MPRFPAESSSDASAARSKRSTACLHCRRQKIKCDGHIRTPCSKCVEDAVECVIRPRANAAIVADDLRWQQTVEDRLIGLTREINQLKAANHTLESRMRAYRPPDISAPPPSAPLPMPSHLDRLRDILRPTLEELQQLVALSVSLDEATVLWEYFYDSLAIYHGFTASPDLTTPSPLLLASIVTASSKRYPHPLVTQSEVWEELFRRALLRLLYETRPKSWDDVVGLGVARTWFWKADEITSGLVYGSFVETTVPTTADVRSRRVWDFLEMTSISHGILHLSTPIFPECPPIGVPARSPSHTLLNALNALFDTLGVVNRALSSAQSLVMAALKEDLLQRNLTYAETVVLQQCKADAEKWGPKWVEELQKAETERLPAGRERRFLIDLILLYQQVAVVVINGYLRQSPQSDQSAFEHSARSLLSAATTNWSSYLHLWPKLFLHCVLIAALALAPSDPLVRQVHALFSPLAPVLQTTGRQLLQRLVDKLQNIVPDPLGPVMTPNTNFDLSSMVTAYTGSDSFWDELSGALGLSTSSSIPLLPESGQFPTSEWY